MAKKNKGRVAKLLRIEEHLINELDKVCNQYGDRSNFVNEALRKWLKECDNDDSKTIIYKWFNNWYNISNDNIVVIA